VRKLGWRQWLLVSLFLAATFVAGFFLVRTVRRAVYWHNHRDQPIRAWMSVPYVSHSYRVPPPLLYNAIGLPPIVHDRRPLREIARDEGRPVETLISELEEAIKHARPPSPDGGARP